MNDATCLLSMAELYTSIGDMSIVKPKEVRVTAAKRLRELVIGDAEENQNMTEAIIAVNADGKEKKKKSLYAMQMHGTKQLYPGKTTFLF